MTSSISKEFSLFAVVGAVSTSAHFLLLWILHAFLGAPVLLATCAGFVVGALVSYFLNRTLTFGSVNPAEGAGSRFAFAVFVGFCVNASLMALLQWGAPAVDYLLRQCVATGLTLVVNFLMSKLWVFKSIGIQHGQRA